MFISFGWRWFGENFGRQIGTVRMGKWNRQNWSLSPSKPEAGGETAGFGGRLRVRAF
jgi:hypothetical protein